MTIDEQIDFAAVLALMVTHLGGLEGRLRVQKLMYLLQRKGVPALEPVFFQYHHYGPFSTDVVDILNEAVGSKIVEEHLEQDGEWKKYTYRPAANLERYANKADNATKKIVEDVLAVCADAHWRVLELAATSDFLRRADKLEWDEAFREALERKPQCAPFLDEARAVVQQLGLS